MTKNIFIVSGEASGDLHGASLMRALQRLMPGIKAAGMGGPRMREAGLTGLDSKEVSVVGITEVVAKLPQLLRAFRELKKLLMNGRFDAVILIDFPDFNLRFARAAKKTGVPIIYYISPQVWAWRRGRVRKIAALVDKMLVVFPFEEDIYRQAGVDVEYVGHPLYAAAVCPLTKGEARAKLGLAGEETVIALLPGSRTAEIRRLLPLMLEAAPLIEKRLGRKTAFILPAADSAEDALLDDILKASPVPVKVLKKETYTALRASDAAVTASGTATLETALIGTPMVIVYKISPLTYAIARMLISIKDMGLPNIVAGRRVVRELVQDTVTPVNIAGEIADILTDSTKKNGIIKDYGEIRGKLAASGPGIAVDRAAAAVFKVINRHGTDKRQR
ncbi:MAG: lipid-A-disaccharide synthase [Deltaproteobacteria bacterium]|nr:lipid-A-disaccharide synthase [Deltaproteobacteria bacterium]